LLRFQAGSSPEGGVQLQLNVNPVFKTKARTQRF
jgi:hypothetical protein